MPCPVHSIYRFPTSVLELELVEPVHGVMGGMGGAYAIQPTRWPEGLEANVPSPAATKESLSQSCSVKGGQGGEVNKRLKSLVMDKSS